MEWLGDLLGTGLSAASGGIFGVLGGIGSSVMKYFTNKQEFDQKKELMKLKSELAVTQESWKALTASHEADQGGANRWPLVDAIKTLYRPVLTTGLFVLVYILYQDILKSLAGQEVVISQIFNGTELKEILRYIIYSMVFTAASAGMWWFSERAFAPPGMKNR